MSAATGADASPTAVARRLKVATGVDCGAVFSTSTFAETEGGVYGELSPGAFPKIAQCLAGLGLWQAAGNVCLDFGHGFGRFAVGALLEAPPEYAAEWLGIELVEARHAHALALQEQLAADAAIGAGQLGFHCGDFMTLPASHPVISRSTVVIGYDVWMYKAATGERRGGAATAGGGGGGGAAAGGVYRAYAAQLARMPHLRAVVTCCYRNRDLRAVLEECGFRYRATLKLPTRGNDLQTALVFDRAPGVPQPPMPIDAGGASDSGRSAPATTTAAAAAVRPPLVARAAGAVGSSTAARGSGGASSSSSSSSSAAASSTGGAAAASAGAAAAVDVLAALLVTARGSAAGSSAAATGSTGALPSTAPAAAAVDTASGASVSGRKRPRAAGDTTAASASVGASSGAATSASTTAKRSGSGNALPRKRRRLAW